MLNLMLNKHKWDKQRIRLRNMCENMSRLRLEFCENTSGPNLKSLKPTRCVKKKYHLHKGAEEIKMRIKIPPVEKLVFFCLCVRGPGRGSCRSLQKDKLHQKWLAPGDSIRDLFKIPRSLEVMIPTFEFGVTWTHHLKKGTFSRRIATY